MLPTERLSLIHAKAYRDGSGKTAAEVLAEDAVRDLPPILVDTNWATEQRIMGFKVLVRSATGAPVVMTVRVHQLRTI
jgi:hypothetical protein